VPDLYQRCIVSGRHKYIWNQGDTEELYDLQEDPYEEHNIVDAGGRQADRAQLRAALREWMAQTDDFLTLD